MLPLHDFNVMACALITVSAAVGYGYTRRHPERRARLNRMFDLQPAKRMLSRRFLGRDKSSADTPMSVDSDASECSSDYPSPTESVAQPADVTEVGSLKRKARDDDIDNSTREGRMSVTLSSERTGSPSRKRLRTLSSQDVQFDAIVTAAEPPSESPDTGAASTLQTSDADIAMISNDSSIQSPTPSAEASSGPLTSLLSTSRTTAISSLPSSFAIPQCKPSSAFSAFVGASSGFGSAIATISASQRPAWCAGTTCGDRSSTPTSGEDSAEQTRQDDQNPAPSATEASIATPGDSVPNALVAHVPTVSTHIALTGEEDEEVQTELKGAKLFVKRGGKDFSSGMLGHLKLLSHKETKEERLVFRREPVWKVSMTVRLRPAVRVQFDEEQGILRIILKEHPQLEEETTTSATTAAQLVIYALTKGKSSKADFTEFARAAEKSAQLLVATRA